MHTILLQMSVSLKSISILEHLTVTIYFLKKKIFYTPWFLRKPTHFLNLSLVSIYFFFILLILKNQYSTFQSWYFYLVY